MVNVTDLMASAQASRDPLTSLGNTLALLTRLGELLRQVDERGRPLTLVQIELGSYAAYLARFGQERGAALLAGFAGFLRDFVAQREDAAAGRPAGEAFRIDTAEFVLALPATGRLDARRLAAALLDGAQAARLALSIGLGVAEPDATDLGVLLLATDGALRAAQERGSGRARLLTQAPKDAAGATGLVEWLARHTLSLQQLLDEAHQLALTDPLTGLPNQRALDQFLLTEMPRALRHDHPFTILLIDGDNLRAFNTELGYEAGDDWIRTLAATLARATRSSDLTVRWRTGDEFVAALPETPRMAAVQVAERIRAAVAHAAKRLPLPVTISIGVAAFPEDGRTTADLLARAEVAIARAKSLGKNRISFADSDPELAD
jgi:diguanylate cyclase (GGDEF)-like protein